MGYNDLSLEYRERCKEEAKKGENVRGEGEEDEEEDERNRETKQIRKKNIYFCEHAEINGITVAFLAYNNRRDHDKLRLQSYEALGF